MNVWYFIAEKKKSNPCISHLIMAGKKRSGGSGKKQTYCLS